MTAIEPEIPTASRTTETSSDTSPPDIIDRLDGVAPPGLASQSRRRDLSAGIYGAFCVLGAAAFLYPFWLPASAVPGQAHARVAPFLAAALVCALVVAVGLELRRQRINGVTVALLGLLSAATGLLRLLDLPGGGSGMFPLLVLAGVAFGARFGLLLGMSSMMLSAVLTGGMGPWLPFQMLAAGWMGGCAGLLGQSTRRLRPRVEVAVVAAFAWVWGFIYGAIMNLWFWPFTVGQGPLSWEPGSGVLGTLEQYHGFYMVTSFAWDAAGALANAVVIVALGAPLLASMRRFAHRLDPVTEFEPARERFLPDGIDPPDGSRPDGIDPPDGSRNPSPTVRSAS